MYIQRGSNFYLQAPKEIDKITDKLDISVLNSKNNIYHFLDLANKCYLGRIEFMLGTDTGVKNIFRVVEHIYIEEIK